MLAKILRAPSADNPTMQVTAQTTIYDSVRLLRSNGFGNLPVIGQKVWLLHSYPDKGGIYYALPMDNIIADEELSADISQWVAPSEARIILQADGSILLKPKKGKHIFAETDAGAKAILLDGDAVTVNGSPPVTGAITLTNPKIYSET